ncbi:hypothetical protein HDU87_003297 [Geranomyces variabilis]|uniref:Uncharacterized protein n=1 Tax=Geranomyces variabilis TaxID=109894 RepID=A0AAD5TK03_9FUNG|nr:hypothetical protein HDU87_003297 [Geranomyces variabilis]
MLASSRYSQTRSPVEAASPSPEPSDVEDLGQLDDEDDELGFLQSSPLDFDDIESVPPILASDDPFSRPGHLHSVRRNDLGESILAEAVKREAPHAAEAFSPAPFRRAEEVGLARRLSFGVSVGTNTADTTAESRPNGSNANQKTMRLKRMHSRGMLLGSVESEETPISPPLPDMNPVPRRDAARSTHRASTILDLPHSVVYAIAVFVQQTQPIYPLLFLCKAWSVPVAEALYYCPAIPTGKQFHLLMRTFLADHARVYSSCVRALRISHEVSDEILMGDLDALLQLCYNLDSFALENGVCASNILVQSLADNVPRLRTLNLRGCSSVTDVLIPSLVRACAQLRYVDLSYTQVTVATISVVLAGCADIEVLEMEGCGPQATSATAQAPEPHAAPTKLRHLNLRNSGADDKLVRNAAERTPQLATCILDGCSAITDEAVLGIAASARDRLRHVDLSFCPALTDIALHALAIHAPEIVTITAAGCDLISAAGVKAIATHTRASLVILHGCARVLASQVIRSVAMHGGPLECTLTAQELRALANGAPTSETQQQPPLPPSLVKRVTAPFIAGGVDQGTQTDYQGQRLSENAHNVNPTEILLKFADAIASGRWAPPGASQHPAFGSYQNHEPRTHEINSHWSQPPQYQPPDWDRSVSMQQHPAHPSFMTPPGSPPPLPPDSVPHAAALKRRSTTSTISSTSISSTGSSAALAGPRSPATLRSRIPTPSRASTFSGSIASGIPTPTRRLTTTQLPRPVSSLGMATTATNTSPRPSPPVRSLTGHRRGSSSTSIGLPGATSEAPGSSEYRPRSFRKFNLAPGETTPTSPPSPSPRRSSPPRQTAARAQQDSRRLSTALRTPTPLPRVAVGKGSVGARTRIAHPTAAPSAHETGWIQGGTGGANSGGDTA